MPPTAQHHYPPLHTHTHRHRHTPAQAPFPWALVPGDAHPSAPHWVLLRSCSWDKAGGPCPSKGPQMKSLHSQGRREVPAPQSHRILGTHTAPAFGQIPSTSQEKKLRLDQDSWLVPGSLSSPRLCPPGAGQPHLPITSDLFPLELPVPRFFTKNKYF